MLILVLPTTPFVKRVREVLVHLTTCENVNRMPTQKPSLATLEPARKRLTEKGREPCRRMTLLPMSLSYLAKSCAGMAPAAVGRGSFCAAAATAHGSTVVLYNEARATVGGRYPPPFRQGYGGGSTQFGHGRSRVSIDPRIPTMPGRSTSGFHPPGRHCLHQARSAVRCSASRMKGELQPSKNRS